jgi:hypothetical protein
MCEIGLSSSLYNSRLPNAGTYNQPRLSATNTTTGCTAAQSTWIEMWKWELELELELEIDRHSLVLVLGSSSFLSPIGTGLRSRLSFHASPI